MRISDWVRRIALRWRRLKNGECEDCGTPLFTCLKEGQYGKEAYTWCAHCAKEVSWD